MNAINIQREDAVLVIIDVQEKLMPSVSDGKKVEETIVKLAKGCRLMEVPIIVTQQYTKGLGPTMAAVAQASAMPAGDGQEMEFRPIEKTSFSAMKEAEFVKALEETNRKTVIIVGVEAHVCVLQTALHMIEAGYSVFAVQDCMASRTQENKELAQIRMAQSCVMVTGYETVLFELLESAKNPCFKQISAIVK